MSVLFTQWQKEDFRRLLAAPGEDGALFSPGVPRAEVYATAAWLRARLPGRGAGTPVCLATEDRSLIAAALLASLAGGPVFILPYAFSRSALEGLIEATGADLAVVDQVRDLPAGMRSLRPERGEAPPLDSYQASPEQEVLRLYSGGTTGRPQIWSKTGVNIFGESFFLAKRFQVVATDRIVATISPCHIYGLLYSVTLPLVSGAVVLATTPSYPEEITRLVQSWQATLLISVPAHYRALREKTLEAPSLRLAFSSAGPLAESDNSRFTANNAVEIVEVYGSTETGGIALRSRYRHEEGFTPYPTIAWRGNGRLQVRSPYLSPDLAVDSEGFFTTGDRVEADGDSGFSLKGRTDAITKVAGNRVDLEEISAFVKTFPGVGDCLVLAIEDGGGRQNRIVAVVEGEAVDSQKLQQALARRFEPYARPRTIKMVGRLPVKENGKYDRLEILGYFR
ncbi:MAG: ANL family adenylate-forming protein [Desulfopila sp.]